MGTPDIREAQQQKSKTRYMCYHELRNGIKNFKDRRVIHRIMKKEQNLLIRYLPCHLGEHLDKIYLW